MHLSSLRKPLLRKINITLLTFTTLLLTSCNSDQYKEKENKSISAEQIFALNEGQRILDTAKIEAMITKTELSDEIIKQIVGETGYSFSNGTLELAFEGKKATVCIKVSGVTPGRCKA